MIGVFLLSLLFVNGCQSITGKAINEIEEKAAPVTGKTVTQITTFRIDEIALHKGKLQDITVNLETGVTPVNPQFKASLFKGDTLVISQNFDFAEVGVKEQRTFVLPLDTPLDVGRYEVEIALYVANEKISSQSQIFRMNLWDKF